MITLKQVTDLIDDFLKEGHLFLLEASVKPVNKITVFIDGDVRATIEDCRRISHYLELRLDREKEDFDLTVSSAGIDRPLQIPRQYRKNVGNCLEITLLDGVTLTGKVVHTDDQGIEIEPLPQKKKKNEAISPISIPFEKIKTAKEVITFKK